MKLNKILATTAAAIIFGSAAAIAETYDDAPPSYYCSQGQNFYKTSQYTSAIKAFRTALRENPNDTSARIGLINSFVSRAEYYNNTEKNPKKALTDLKSAAFYFACYNGKPAKTGYNQAYMAAVSNLNTLERSLNADITGGGLVKSGQNLRVQGEFAAAGYDFYRAIEDPVNEKAANIGMGDVLNILGQPKIAIPYYEKALQLSPEDADLRLKVARAYEKAGEGTLAEQHYNYALKNSNEKEEILNSLEKICRQRSEANPADAEAHCNLGVIYQKRGKTTEAIAEYQKAEKLNPALITTKTNMAILYYDKKQYKEAIECCNKALLISPKNTQARLQKAKSFQALSLWENATEEYKNVLKYEPENSEAQFGLAEIYTKNMSGEDALAQIQAQGIKLSPEFYAKTAYNAHKSKDIAKAEQYYKLAIEANPNDKALYLNLAQIYNGKNDYANAMVYAQKAKQLFPTDEQVNNLYKDIKTRIATNAFDEADALRDGGSYEAAIEKYKAIQPQNYDTYISIAGTYQMMKDYPNAIVYYKKALETNPTDETVLMAMSGIYIYQNDLANAEMTVKKIKNQQNPKVKEIVAYIDSQKAETEMNNAISKYENKDYAGAETILTSLINKKLGGYMPYYYRAMVYDALGKYQQAINDYESVIAKDSTVALVYYSLGVDYDTLKNFPRAIQNYRKYLELTNETNDYTEYARQRIKQSQ